MLVSAAPPHDRRSPSRAVALAAMSRAPEPSSSSLDRSPTDRSYGGGQFWYQLSDPATLSWVFCFSDDASEREHLRFFLVMIDDEMGKGTCCRNLLGSCSRFIGAGVVLHVAVADVCAAVCRKQELLTCPIGTREESIHSTNSH